MIERMTAKPGVLAFRVEGHVAREDVDKCFELLAENFESHPKVNLYVEVAGLSGFDTEALSDDFKRGWALLDKLDRFGRVAIVSDETWIRWLSRVESALLPGISYRTYTLAIEIDGRLSSEEVGQLAHELNRMRGERPLKGMLVLFRTLAGVDPSIAMDGEYLRMKLGLIRELDRYAVVGGPDWLKTWLNLWQPLLRLELRHFDQ